MLVYAPEYASAEVIRGGVVQRVWAHVPGLFCGGSTWAEGIFCFAPFGVLA